MAIIKKERAPHIFWVCPDGQFFFRTKGEVKSRPLSQIPKLVEEGYELDALIPYDAALLPKTRLPSTRIISLKISLAQTHQVEIIKLARGSASPGVYMMKTDVTEPALYWALFCKTALGLALHLKHRVDVFHLFDWQTGLFPIYLEMAKASDPQFFKTTRTFFNVRSLRHQGNFPLENFSPLGLPSTLLNSHGLEFYGTMSFMKAGLVFSDAVGLVENNRLYKYRNGTGLEGVLDSVIFKLRLWASSRAIKPYLDAYKELLAGPRVKPVWSRFFQKEKEGKRAPSHEITAAQQMWGPDLPIHYHRNQLRFLVQSPFKAYAFWEWAGEPKSLGILIEHQNSGERMILAQDLPGLGDFWVNVEPDSAYRVELFARLPSGEMETLLRSNLIRTPRTRPSLNTKAVFINAKTGKRIQLSEFPFLRKTSAGFFRVHSGTWGFALSESSFTVHTSKTS